MIKQINLYEIHCDKCKRALTDGMYMPEYYHAYNEARAAVVRNGWKEVVNKDFSDTICVYCPTCYKEHLRSDV